MTRPHYHPLKGGGGLAAVEHEHPGRDVRHVHEGDPNLGPSTAKDAMDERLRAMGARAGRPLPRRES